MPRKTSPINEGDTLAICIDLSRPGTRHCAPMSRVDATVSEVREKAVRVTAKTDQGRGTPVSVWLPRKAIRRDDALTFLAEWFRFDPRQQAWWNRCAYFWGA